jgi:anti-sigma regulatory factor (Ser/Thr protein kinase)
MEKKLERKIGALEEIFPLLEEFLSDRGLDPAAKYAVNLAAEEIFTNLVRHNQGGGDHILLELEQKPGEIVLRLTDFDVEPFDLDKVKPVDVRAPLSERGSGGLGLHLVKNLVDELDYHYADGDLKVTAIKRLEE